VLGGLNKKRKGNSLSNKKKKRSWLCRPATTYGSANIEKLPRQGRTGTEGRRMKAESKSQHRNDRKDRGDIISSGRDQENMRVERAHVGVTKGEKASGHIVRKGGTSHRCLGLTAF